MKSLNKIKKQKAFSILSVILLIAVVVVAISIWILSGETNTTNSKKTVDDVYISALINDGLTLKSSFDKLIINGADPLKVVFLPNVLSTDLAPNILDPVNGTNYPLVNSMLLRKGYSSPEGLWVKRTIHGKNLGLTTSGFDIVVAIGGISDDACQKINYNLHGSTVVPKMVAISGNLINGFSGATATNPNVISLLNLNLISATVEPDGWVNGCIGSTTNPIDNNMYYQAIKVN